MSYLRIFLKKWNFNENFTKSNLFPGNILPHHYAKLQPERFFFFWSKVNQTFVLVLKIISYKSSHSTRTGSCQRDAGNFVNILNQLVYMSRKNINKKAITKVSGHSEVFGNGKIMPHDEVRRLKYSSDFLHLFFCLLSEILFIIHYNILKCILLYINLFNSTH